MTAVVGRTHNRRGIVWKVCNEQMFYSVQAALLFLIRMSRFKCLARRTSVLAAVRLVFLQSVQTNTGNPSPQATTALCLSVSQFDKTWLRQALRRRLTLTTETRPDAKKLSVRYSSLSWYLEKRLCISFCFGLNVRKLIDSRHFSRIVTLLLQLTSGSFFFVLHSS